MDVATEVETNLVHYTLWTDVKVILRGGPFSLLRGQPPSKLADQDPENQKEWVIPKPMHESKCSMAEIESWFEYVASIDVRPKRITLAIVNDDGTVVYYFVHDGVIKPRQN
ncbi:hypothetical protein JCM33374_g3266 [Metschnikowia sp. JCM 33374]|nr:hypothetical protein JCM33374_g3266 [Metschnikowia sp. JCM 33374]